MDEAAKRRLVGAAVLVALAVIFVPMLVEQDADDDLGDPIVIPEPPSFDEDASDGGLAAEDALPEPEDLMMPLPTPEPPASAAEPAEPAETVRAEQPAPTEARPDDTKQVAAPPERPAQPAASAGPKPVPKGVSAWVIQVASLGSPEAARGLQDELRAKGYPAFVEQATVRGQRYYRVRVGPEIERARADQLAKRLASDTGNDPLVQRYP
jgi:DedD protein